MRIKSIVHVVAAWIMLVLTSEFSLTVAYDICDTNPWARILYVALNISGLLAAFYLYTRYIMKIKCRIFDWGNLSRKDNGALQQLLCHWQYAAFIFFL